MTTRVTGIGGVFFTSRDPRALGDWYREHLGIDVQSWGGASFTGEAGDVTSWRIADELDAPFAPSDSSFMINFRVADLDSVLAALTAEDCDVDPNVESSEYGKFGWVTDPDGNRIELWEPAATSAS